MITQYRATIDEMENGGFVITYEQYNERFEMWERVDAIIRETGYGRRYTIKPGTLYKRDSIRVPILKDRASWHWSAKMLAERQIDRWTREDKKRSRELRSTVIEGKKLDL